jgi:hypothetical protein
MFGIDSNQTVILLLVELANDFIIFLIVDSIVVGYQPW